jgi:hypothetical protein
MSYFKVVQCLAVNANPEAHMSAALTYIHV